MTDSPDAMAESPDADGTPAGNDDHAGTENRAGEADEASPPARSEATDELWREVGAAPVKVALPGGQVGYTLRAYRPADQLTPTEAPPPAEDDEADPFAERERARAAEDAELVAETDEVAGTDELGEPAPEDFRDEADEEDREAADEEAARADEEAPVFLSHRGTLLLFGSPESLIAFISSDAPHDLTQLETWSTLAKRVQPADIVPTEEDTYELDLVVENLRGGHDAWDLPLLIAAGEFARDVGWALRLTPVITAMSSGSPLDDLDEALRASASGGVGGLFARRRLRRMGAQQASLGWRTVIGKITAAVDWRD